MQTLERPHDPTDDRRPTSDEVLDQHTSHDVRVARQPIFDDHKKVYGYELLFRSGIENACPPSTDRTEAARHVSHVAWLDLGLSTLVGQKLAFVNVTRDLLVSGFVTALPAESIVVELLEDIDPDDEVLQACRELKQTGYTIALDDFIYRPELEPLVELADIVKVRLGDCDLTEQCAHVRRVQTGTRLLAEKVETHEEYRLAAGLGCTYFQGYFFQRPQIVTGRALSGSRLTYLKLIQAVSRPSLDIDEVERVITSDVSITHRFMKYLGSASFGWRVPVQSIHQALVLLGQQQTRRWVSLISLSEMSKDKPAELLVTSAVRAKFCDELSSEVGMVDRRADLFLLGAFSLIDTMLDQPMSDVLAQLPLQDDLKTALHGEANALGLVLKFVQAYEQCVWDDCARLGREIGLEDAKATSLYRRSVVWATEAFRST